VNSEKADSAFIERLKVLLNGAKPYPWAASVGITQATFNRMWKDGIAPKADVLLLISEKTGCSIDWLLTGKGEIKGSEKGMQVQADHLADAGKVMEVKPLFGKPEQPHAWFHEWIEEELQGKTISEVMAVAVKIKGVLDESKGER